MAIDELKTHPAITQLEKDVRLLTAVEAAKSRQARHQVRAGTLIGLGGAAAAIVALLCLLAYMTRRADRQQAESREQLRQSQKMEAVGQLAGGVAHDFNNLLTAISGYSELALSRLDNHPDPELRADIEEIAKSGERAAGLTRQLLALSRRQTLQPTAFDLNEAVVGTESLLKRLLGTHIAIAMTLDTDECAVLADHGQIEQVIENLAGPAGDAMPEGGILRIETEAVQLGKVEAQERFHAPAGEYVLLRIADDGSGMDQATQQRAFEPFYTTKAPGEGTGLGLATVYGIVAQTGGFINIESEPGSGTTLDVLLPRVAAAAVVEPTRTRRPSGGSERILLVEDEEVVRNLTYALLSREGYNVTLASDGAHALELSSVGRFDLVITDMVMPQMSGRALAQQLLEGRPGLPIIFISGYAHDVNGKADSVGAFLQKPFTAHDLSEAVRQSLDCATQRAA